MLRGRPQPRERGLSSWREVHKPWPLIHRDRKAVTSAKRRGGSRAPGSRTWEGPIQTTLSWGSRAPLGSRGPLRPQPDPAGQTPSSDAWSSRVRLFLASRVCGPEGDAFLYGGFGVDTVPPWPSNVLTMSPNRPFWLRLSLVPRQHCAAPAALHLRVPPRGPEGRQPMAVCHPRVCMHEAGGGRVGTPG